MDHRSRISIWGLAGLISLHSSIHRRQHHAFVTRIGKVRPGETKSDKIYGRANVLRKLLRDPRRHKTGTE